MAQPFAQGIPLQGGIDIRLDPRVIRDDQMSKLANVYPDANGILQKRPPLRYAFSVANSASFTRVISIARAAPASGAAYIVVGVNYNGVGVRLSALDADGRLVAAYPSVVGDGVAAIAVPQIVTYENQSIVFLGGGYDGCIVWHDGQWRTCSYLLDVPLTQVQPQTAGVVSPEVAFTYRGRVVIANFGPGYRTSYTMSDYRFPPTYAPPSQFFVPRFLFVGSEMLAFNAPHRAELRDEIDPIVAGIECMLQMVGSATESAFLLFGNKYAYIGTGVLGSTVETNPDLLEGDLQLKRVNYDCGCAGPRTLIRTQFGVLWMGPDDVWLMDIGGIPRRVGTNIRSAIQACPPSLLQNAWAVFADNTFRLAIPNQMSSNVGPEFTHFWLDMRDGPPKDEATARWYGPHEYTHVSTESEPLVGYMGPGVVDDIGNVLIPCALGNNTEVGTYVVFANVSGPGELMWDFAFPIANDPLTFDELADYSVGDIVRPRDQNTVVHGENGHLYMCTTAGNAGGGAPVWPPSGTVTEGTVTFTELFSLTGLNYRCPQSNLGTGSAPTHLARSFQTQVLMDIQSKDYDHGAKSQNKTLNRVEVTVEAELPGALECTLIENNGSSEDTAEVLTATQANSQLGSFRLSASIASNEEHHRSFRPDSAERALFQCAIYKFSENTSWVIDASNDTIFLIGKNGTFTTTIAQGKYASMTALCTAVVNAIAAVLTARGNEVFATYTNRTGNTGQPVVVSIQFQGGGVDYDGGVSLIFNDPSDTDANQVLQKRCANLFALLGYDTSRDRGAGIQGTWPIYDGASANILRTYASVSVPERNCQNWRMIDAVAFGRVWGARPYTRSDRKTGNE